MGVAVTHSKFIIWIDETKKEGEREKVTFAIQDKEIEERETGTYTIQQERKSLSRHGSL